MERHLGKQSVIRGVLLLLLSTIFSAVSGLFCKLSSLNGVEVSWAMGVGGTFLSIMTFSLLRRGNEKVFSRPYLKALANGVVLRGLATYLYFLSLDYITATDSMVITLFVSIVWATVLEAIRLKIMPHWMAVVSAVIGLAGMVFMCKPEGLVNMDMDVTYLKGVSLSALAGCLSSTYYVNVNKLGNVAALWHWVAYPIGLWVLTKPEISINHFELTACSLWDRLFGFGAGILQLLAGLCAIKGTQLTLASVSFVIKLFGIVLTFLLQVALLPNPVTLNSIIGGVCIIVAMALQFLVLSIRKRSNHPKDETAV